MNKFGVKLVCSLIPNKNKRKRVRNILLGLDDICDSDKSFIRGMNTIDNIQNDLNYKFKRQSIISQRLLIASIVNKNFEKFKGIYRGKELVLIAAGPTVNDFEPIKDAIYIGCNRAFLLDKVNFDYLFAIDKVGINNYYESFFNYKKENCIKFVGDQNLGCNYQIPEDVITLDNNTYRYITNAGIEDGVNEYPLDISVFPLLNPPTVSLQAMQFALWTQPSTIYIVGVDCTCATKKHFSGKDTDCSFRNENVENNDDASIKSYKLLKEFAKTYYPNTKIVSVNPIGLKGIFEEVYTKSFIDKNQNLISELGTNLKYLEQQEE